MQLWWKKIVLGLGKVIPFKKSAPHLWSCCVMASSFQEALVTACKIYYEPSKTCLKQLFNHNSEV